MRAQDWLEVDFVTYVEFVMCSRAETLDEGFVTAVMAIWFISMLFDGLGACTIQCQILHCCRLKDCRLDLVPF